VQQNAVKALSKRLLYCINNNAILSSNSYR